MSRLSKRDKDLVTVETALRLFLHNLSEEYNLTTNELMLILIDSTSKLFRVLVKAERPTRE